MNICRHALLFGGGRVAAQSVGILADGLTAREGCRLRSVTANKAVRKEGLGLTRALFIFEEENRDVSLHEGLARVVESRVLYVVLGGAVRVSN